MQEAANGDYDTIQPTGTAGGLMVLEPRVKYDLTKYTEKWPFTFDLYMQEQVRRDVPGRRGNRRAGPVKSITAPVMVAMQVV